MNTFIIHPLFIKFGPMIALSEGEEAWVGAKGLNTSISKSYLNPKNSALTSG